MIFLVFKSILYRNALLKAKLQPEVKMEIYAPSYYEKFKCIADRCNHSCCIDWEISIDEKALNKYRALKTDLGKEILNNISSDESGAHFVLDKRNRCSNLDGRGLCRIISELGEGYLCDICRLHPRFFNEVGGRIEMGLGLSCEEAVRITLTETQRFNLVKIGESEEKIKSDPPDFDAQRERDGVISFFESTSGSYEEKIKATRKKYGIETDFNTEDEWIELLLSLEILDNGWKELLEKSKKASRKIIPEELLMCFENLFKYLVFRHVSSAESKLSFLSRLSFSFFCVDLVKYLAGREECLNEARLFEIVRLFSSEIEYSEENTESLIFEFEANII